MRQLSPLATATLGDQLPSGEPGLCAGGEVFSVDTQEEGVEDGPGQESSWPAAGCHWRARCRCCGRDSMRPACRAGDTSLRWPCSECACGTAGADAEPPADVVPVAVTSFGDGHKGGMERGPAVGSSPGRCPGSGLAPPAPPEVLQSTRQTLGSQLSPLSVVSGGLFGTLPRMRQALCLLCS